jgi:hypothetical protein
MKRTVLVALFVALPSLWAAGLLVHRAYTVPAVAAAFAGPFPSLPDQLNDNPKIGGFHRFINAIRPVIPPRARVILIGPAAAGWAGLREDHYKYFLFRMVPRPVRAVREVEEIPDRLAWTDFVVVYRMRLPAAEIQGFTCVLELEPDGRVYRREEPRP